MDEICRSGPILRPEKGSKINQPPMKRQREGNPKTESKSFILPARIPAAIALRCQYLHCQVSPLPAASKRLKIISSTSESLTLKTSARISLAASSSRAVASTWKVRCPTALFCGLINCPRTPAIACYSTCKDKYFRRKTIAENHFYIIESMNKIQKRE